MAENTLLDKVLSLQDKYRALQDQLADPQVVADMKKYVQLNKDYKQLEPIIQAGQAALANGKTRYTAARGLPELREAISGFYQQRYGLDVDEKGRTRVSRRKSGAGDWMVEVDPAVAERVAEVQDCSEAVLGGVGFDDGDFDAEGGSYDVRKD